MSQIPEVLWGRAPPPPGVLCKARMENTALMNLHQGFERRRIAHAAGPSKDTDPAQCTCLVFQSFPSTERQCRAGEMGRVRRRHPAQQPEFTLWNPHDGRESTPTKYPLISTPAPWHMPHPHPHPMCIHTENKHSFLKAIPCMCNTGGGI